MNRWQSYYDLPPGQIIPLVFDNWGNWHPKTTEFLGWVTTKLSDGDKIFAAKLLLHFREVIAVGIAESQAGIIRSLRRHISRQRQSQST